MKKSKCLCLVAVCILFISACTSTSTSPTVDVDTTTYREVDGKPVKRTPMLEGNFEIIQGSRVPLPLDMALFEESVLLELNQHGYTVEEIEEGVILARLTRSSYWVEFKVCYWIDEYWFEYINSENLGANPAKDKIHRSYRRWIANLDKRTNRTYYRTINGF